MDRLDKLRMVFEAIHQVREELAQANLSGDHDRIIDARRRLSSLQDTVDYDLMTEIMSASSEDDAA